MMKCCLSNILLLLLLSTSNARGILGGEKAKYDTPVLTEITDESIHRQNVCGRYEAFRSGEIELRDGLSGMELRPMLLVDEYFRYNPEEGIDPETPGLLANLMDELAERANFTWRNSFGVAYAPGFENETLAPPGQTYSEILLWSANQYDLTVSWWDKSLDRLEEGIAYVDPWFDSSILLVEKQLEVEAEKKLFVFNWTRPFDTVVWWLILFSIVGSAFAYMLIEFLDNDRNDRSMSQWTLDNIYLSILNFTQNYEYAPTSLSARLLSVSMALWALVITSTYTANLASLLVDEKAYRPGVTGIEEAIVLNRKICTYAESNSDTLIRDKYEDAIRIPKKTQLETFQALNSGECDLVAAYKDNWEMYKTDRAYNPDCDLRWVGRTVEVINSGFAVKADVGYKCTGFIRDVFNLHLNELIEDNRLKDFWEEHRKTYYGSTVSCVDENTEATASEVQNNDEILRHLENKNDSTLVPSTHHQEPPQHSTYLSKTEQQKRTRNLRPRRLKGGGNAASTSSLISSGTENRSLHITQLAGIFIVHFSAMGIAIIMAFISRYRRKRGFSNGIKLKFRENGPIIGQPPPLNTMIRETSPSKSTTDLPTDEIQTIHDNHDTSTRSVWTNRSIRTTTRQQSVRVRRNVSSKWIDLAAEGGNTTLTWSGETYQNQLDEIQSEQRAMTIQLQTLIQSLQNSKSLSSVGIPTMDTTRTKKDADESKTE